MATLIGFDFGTRKIGIAVGQTITASATPLTSLSYIADKPDWQGISALINEWQPDALIVGLPYNMDDTEMDWAPLVKRFARQLQGRYNLPVHLADERLTSKEARHQLNAHPDRHRRNPTLAEVDAVAAALIVETWLAEH